LRIHAYEFSSASLLFELDHARDKREQRVIRPAPNARAWLELGATLTDQDFSAKHCLPAETFNAQTLGVRVASVTRTAYSLFVCHKASSKTRGQRSESQTEGPPGRLLILLAERVDAHGGEVLAMAVGLLVLLAAFLFEHNYFWPSPMLNYGGLDAAVSQFNLVSVSSKQRVKFDRRADIGGNQRDLNDLAFSDVKLFATSLNDRVCHS